MAGYYQDIADAVPVPVLIYNAPGFTGMTVSPKVIEKISGHPNITGMKDTSPAGMSGYLAVCDARFTVLSGTISTLFQALALGAKGGVVSLADAFPAPCCELFDTFMAGDIATARQLHYTLFKLNHSVSGSFGVAGVKYAMELGGYQGGPPRLPLLPLKDADRQKIRTAVEAAGIL
jgi:4-hydroxy-2-oxoglutarate aldolase